MLSKKILYHPYIKAYYLGSTVLMVLYVLNNEPTLSFRSKYPLMWTKFNPEEHLFNTNSQIVSAK